MFLTSILRHMLHQARRLSGKLFSVLIMILLAFAFDAPQLRAYGTQDNSCLLAQPTPPAQTESVAQLFLPLVMGGIPPTEHDERPSRPSNMVSASNHTGGSSTPPPEGNRHTFVTDSGGHLDGYWFRSDLPDGQLKFTIEITSPVLSPLHIDEQGFLSPHGAQFYVSRGVIPSEAILTLEVHDVDHDAEVVCPEQDYVRINGRQITLLDDTTPAILRSGNEQWNTWKVSFPITYLKFPIATFPFGGVPASAINEIAVEIDVACEDEGWAVKVDWGSITLRPNLTTPIVFIHGWTGNIDTFAEFTDRATEDGYQAFNIEKPDDLSRGIATLEETAPQVVSLIERALTTSGANKVFVVAHSRGGIFIRQALRMYQDLTSGVAGYLTISTPHHGTDIMDLISLAKCHSFLGAGQYGKCFTAAHSLTARPMQEFNYGKTCGKRRFVSTELFEIGTELLGLGVGDYASQLDEKELSQALRDKFSQHGYPLAIDAYVKEVKQPGQEWFIVSDTKGYELRQGCVPGLCILSIRWWMPLHEDTDENPSDEDYWIDCRPQWKNGEATVPAYSVASSVLPYADIGTKTATFPWLADASPFPDSPNIDAEFCKAHWDSNSAPEIYVYALDRLASTVQPSSAQAAASSQVEPEPLAQPLFSVSGILAPGAAPTFTVPIESVLTATFHVFASPQVSVTLLTPNNELVDPSTPLTNPQVTYTVQPGDEFTFYQYRVDAPAWGWAATRTISTFAPPPAWAKQRPARSASSGTPPPTGWRAATCAALA